MDDIQFTWDEQKNIINIAKHGVSFADAAKVYFDPERLELYDDQHSMMNEERWNVIGNVNLKTLFVVSIGRVDNLIRIISARRATKKEQEEYYGNRC